MAVPLNIKYTADEILELWDPIEQDESIHECEFTFLSETTNALATNNGIPAQGTRYSFQSTDQDSYCLPSRSYINIQCQIVNAAGANIAAADPLLTGAGVAIQNNFPLWDACYFMMNGQTLHQTPNWLARKHLVKNLLDYSNDDSGTTFLDQGWSLDEGLPLNAAGVVPGAGVASVPATTQAMGVREPELNTYVLGANNGPGPGAGITASMRINPSYNRGFVQRANLVTNFGLGNGLFNLRIPVNRLVDILAIDRVYVGTSLGLQLIVGPQNILNLFQVAQIQTYAPATNTITYAAAIAGTPANADPPYNMALKNIYWCLPYLKLSPNADLILKKRMMENPISAAMYEDCLVYPYQVTVSPSMTVNWLIQTASEKVSKVMIGFTWSNLYNDATQANNSQVFANVAPYILNSWLRYGQTLYPRNQYKPQPGAALGGIVQPLEAIQNISNRLWDWEGGSSFTMNNYSNNGQYFLLPFDLRFAHTNSFSPGQTMDLFLNITMGTNSSNQAIPQNLGNLTVWAFVFTERTIKFNYAGGKILANPN